MKINEVLNHEEMLRTIEMIFNNTIAQIRNSGAIQNPQAIASTQLAMQKKPLVAQTAKSKSSAPKPKKAPYAAPPKPLPKPKPQALTMAKTYDQQQQKLAGHIAKAMTAKNNSTMPASLQPLPTSVLSPIDSIDKDKMKKFEKAKRDADMRPEKLDKDWVLSHKNGYLP